MREDSCHICEDPPPCERYSTEQMHDFYPAFSRGDVRPSGVMNLVQHLIAAECCRGADSVLDLCCGRGLLLPPLQSVSPTVARYTGVDVCRRNLDEARRRAAELSLPFPCQFIEGDATRLSEHVSDASDVIVFTSSLEHMQAAEGMRSLAESHAALASGGVLVLSTPCSPDGSLQYSVHVYEWGRDEVEDLLCSLGFEIVACHGLLGDEGLHLEALEHRFGRGAADWYEALQAVAPAALLEPVASLCLPEVAREILWICQKG